MLPPGEPGVLLSGPLTGLVDCCMPPVLIWWLPGGPGLKPCAAFGVPCLDSENAFIFACISDVRPLALVVGTGLRAALTGPSGADEALIPGAGKSLEFRSEGGFGDSSGDGGDCGCPSSVTLVGPGEGVFAVGFSILQGGPATWAQEVCSMLASRKAELDCSGHGRECSDAQEVAAQSRFQSSSQVRG